MIDPTLEQSELERMIIAAKIKYKNIFATTVGEDLFVWRLLRSSEYEIICKSSNGDLDLKEELVCQYAVIYPEVNFSSYKAGVPSQIAPQILEESGFISAEKTHDFLNTCRAGILDKFQEQAFIIIASAFPQYKFEEIEEWEMEKLLKMVARAEWKLNVLDGNEFIFEEVDTNDEEEEVDQDAALKEMEEKIIERGGDPIFTLYDSIYKKKPPFFDYPFIMGNNIHREDVVDAVRRSIEKRQSTS